MGVRFVCNSKVVRRGCAQLNLGPPLYKQHRLKAANTDRGLMATQAKHRWNTDQGPMATQAKHQ